MLRGAGKGQGGSSILPPTWAGTGGPWWTLVAACGPLAAWRRPGRRYEARCTGAAHRVLRQSIMGDAGLGPELRSALPRPGPLWRLLWSGGVRTFHERSLTGDVSLRRVPRMRPGAGLAADLSFCCPCLARSRLGRDGMKRLWRSGSGSGVSAPPDAADSPASPVTGSAGGELLGGPAVRRRRRRRLILIAAPFLVVLLWAIASYTVCPLDAAAYEPVVGRTQCRVGQTGCTFRQ